MRERVLCFGHDGRVAIDGCLPCWCDQHMLTVSLRHGWQCVPPCCAPLPRSFTCCAIACCTCLASRGSPMPPMSPTCTQQSAPGWVDDVTCMRLRLCTNAVSFRRS